VQGNLTSSVDLILMARYSSTIASFNSFSSSTWLSVLSMWFLRRILLVVSTLALLVFCYLLAVCYELCGRSCLDFPDLEPLILPDWFASPPPKMSGREELFCFWVAVTSFELAEGLTSDICCNVRVIYSDESCWCTLLCRPSCREWAR